MVLSAASLKLGVTLPLHIRDVCDEYTLASIQINPNIYRFMIGLYILYHQEKYPSVMAKDIGYLIQLKKAPKWDFGYVYFTVWP